MVMLSEMPIPSDGLLYAQNMTTAVVNDNSLGFGSLYITESRVSWLNEAGLGFSLDYPNIALHAVSRDLTAYPKPCLYVMVDGNIQDDEVDESDDDEVDDDDEAITEIRFVPEDANSLDILHQAMSDGNMLHPDPDDSLSDEDDENYTPETEQESCFRTEDNHRENGSDEAMEDAADASQFENAD